MRFRNFFERHLFGLFGCLVCCQAAYGQMEIPQITAEFSKIAERLHSYQTILKPDRDEAEWWAGAPSVVRDSAGTFWMACRMRDAVSPRGKRGYEIRILKSYDGKHFQAVHSIHRDQVPIPGFERPCLLFDSHKKIFKLYCCGPLHNDIWSIIKFQDAALPTEFAASTAYAVITPPEKQAERDIVISGYKDPVIFFDGAIYHAYVIGYLRQLERVYHFTSPDGESWQPVGYRNQAVLNLTSWHDFFIRPASVLPLGFGYLWVYEGSKTTWNDPVYNIVTGLAFTFNLHDLIDLTPEAPLAFSTTPGSFYTWRYSHWMWVGNELWIYAEVAAPNDSHEIRLFTLPRE